MRGRIFVCIVFGMLTTMPLSGTIGIFILENGEDGLINNILNTNIETGLFPLDIIENPIRLTNNSYKDQEPKINDVGQVVWRGGGNPGYLDEIYFWDGYNTLKLTNDNYPDSNPQINNNGEVVWQGGEDQQIYFWDGFTITQVTYTGLNARPQLNDCGQVVWHGEDISGLGLDIYLWDGYNTTKITDTPYPYDDVWPMINNNGQIAWELEEQTKDTEVYFWNGSDIIQITDNNVYDINPKINELGQVVWYSYDGSNTDTYEICYWNGTDAIQLTDNNYEDSGASINDDGYIVWTGFDGNDYEIFLWDGNQVTQFTDNIYSEYDANINNNRQIVWSSNSTGNFDTFFWNAYNLTYRIQNDFYEDWFQKVNDNGQIAWVGYKNDNQLWEIFYWEEPGTPHNPELVYSITLLEGWNLISSPLDQSNDSLTLVLQSITGKWNVVKYYDTLDKTDPWKTYRPGSSLNDLANIDNTMGFWIYITQPNVTLTVSGSEPTLTAITLYAGWNLVGYPSQTEMLVGNALWGTGADRVEVFDTGSPYIISEVGPTYMMKPGEGYWVHVPADTVWTVDW